MSLAKVSTYLFYVWKIAFMLWISCTAIIVLLYLFSRGLSFLTFPILALFSNLLLYAITLIVLAASHYGIVVTLLFLKNPSKYFLGGLRLLKVGESIDRLVGSLANKANVRKPKVELVEKKSSPFTFGVTDDKVSLVIPKNLMKILDKDELETVILHELFHAKYDVESQTSNIATDKLLVPKYATLINIFFLITALWAVFNWPGRASVLLVSQSLVTLKSFLYIFGGVLILGIFMIMILFIVMWKQGTFLTARYLYVRELLADGFSVLMSEKPKKLQSAIRKITHTRYFSKSNSDILGEVGVLSSPEQEMPRRNIPLSTLIESKGINKKTWVDTAKDTKTHYVEDKSDYRRPFIDLIGKLLQEKCSLTVLESDFEKMSLKPRRNIPKPVYDFARGNKTRFIKFLDYAIKNADHFNIMECSNYLKIQPHESLFFLWTAASGKILDFTETKT